MKASTREFDTLNLKKYRQAATGLYFFLSNFLFLYIGFLVFL